MSQQTYITRDTVAAMLAADVRTITRWQSDAADPLPVAISGARGKPNSYDIRAVYVWGLRRALADLVGSSDGTDYDFAKERARLTHEQADKVELENAQLRGELLPVALLEQVLVESFSSIRAHLLAAPANHSILLFECATVDELRARLTEIVERLLNELAVDELSTAAIARIDKAAGGPGNPKAKTKGKRG